MNARLILYAALICRVNATTTFDRTRKRLQKRFKRELVRVIEFAKHETLRKAHRYLHRNRPLMGAEEDHPDSSKIVFDEEELRRDIQTLLETEFPITITTAADDTLKSVGYYGTPYNVPSQDVLDFISRRENLLSDVPSEIFQKVKDTISEGLNQGESISDLSTRITEAFSEIESGRAETIAETETLAAYNYASNKAAQAAGIAFKQWIHGGSQVPRPDHIAIDGMIVPFEEAFPVGSPPLMYPHDPNGSPEDVINCSCFSIPATEEGYKAQ
jgi:hypothetical protein